MYDTSMLLYYYSIIDPLYEPIYILLYVLLCNTLYITHNTSI